MHGARARYNHPRYMPAVGTNLVKNVDSEASTSICKHLAVYDWVEFLNIEGFKNFCVEFRSALFHYFKVVYGQFSLLTFDTSLNVLTHSCKLLPCYGQMLPHPLYHESVAQTYVHCVWITQTSEFIHNS